MYSTFSHCCQETLSTENVLTGRGPHRRLENLLTHGTVEIIFGVRRGRGKLLGHDRRWGNKAAVGAAAEAEVAVAVAAPGPTP